jgi:AcrR family transcriptional regulator
VPSPRGAVNRRGAATRDAILDAAVELFATRGYRGSGILELAKRVGITHAGVLHHFGTKENLLRAVVARRDEAQAARFAEVDAPDRAVLPLLGDARPFIEPALLTRLTAVLRTENLDPDDPLHEYFVERERYARSVVADEIRRGQADGQLRPDVDPDVKAAEVLAFVIGIELQWMLSPDLVDPYAAYASFARALLDDLAREPA